MGALKSLQSNDLMMTVAASRSQRIEVVFGLSSPKHRGCGILGSHCNANASRRSIVVTFRPTNRPICLRLQRATSPLPIGAMGPRRSSDDHYVSSFLPSRPLFPSRSVLFCLCFSLSVGRSTGRQRGRERPTEEFAPAGSVGYAFAPLSAPLRSSPPSFPSSLHRTALLVGRGVHSLCPGDDNMLNSGSGRPAAATASRQARQEDGQVKLRQGSRGKLKLMDRRTSSTSSNSCRRCLHGSTGNRFQFQS